MTCIHLRKLYEICDQYDLKMSSSDIIRITCPECGLQETCPSMHLDDNPSDGERQDEATV